MHIRWKMMNDLSFLRKSTLARFISKYCYIFLVVDVILISLVVYAWYVICDYNFCSTISSRPRTNILAFGDSITRGFVRKPNTYYPYSKSLEKTLNRLHAKDVDFIVHNAGINGDKALDTGTTKRLKDSLRQRNYEWVIILLGTNDLPHRYHSAPVNVEVSASDVFAKLVKLSKIALGGYRTVIIGTLTARQCEMDGFFETTCDSFAKNRQILNEKLRSFVSNSTDMLLLADFDKELNYNEMDDKTRSKYWADNVHFTQSGYERMAKLVYKKMLPYLPAMTGRPLSNQNKVLLKG